MVPDEDTECVTKCDRNSSCELDATTKEYACYCLSGYNKTETKDAPISYTNRGSIKAIRIAFFDKNSKISMTVMSVSLPPK